MVFEKWPFRDSQLIRQTVRINSQFNIDMTQHARINFLPSLSEYAQSAKKIYTRLASQHNGIYLGATIKTLESYSIHNFDRGANFYSSHDFIHLIISHCDTAIGPIAFLVNPCKMAKTIFLTMNHNIAARTDAL